MFLNKKKGDIVAQFVVLLVVAVILIFVVSAFGAKMWSAFFPDEDKSTLKSFEALYSVLEAKSVSTASYDSTIMNLYLADDYQIALFTNGKADCRESHWYGNTVTIYTAPSDCEAGKQCLCLYSDVPSTKDSKKDKYVVKCRSITRTMKLDKTYFFLNDRVCGDQNVYSSYIIAKRIVGATSFLYILPDNDANRAQDKLWNIPTCTTDNDKRDVLCFDRGDGSSYTPNTDAGMEQVYNYCKAQQQVSSTGVLCTYYKGTSGADDRGCKIDCSYGDIKKESLTKCEYFNKVQSIAPYLNKDTYYKYYYMCANDAKYYNLGCKISQFEAFVCANSIDGAENSKCHPPAGCDLEYLDEPIGDTGRFITSYDDKKTECSTYMKANYYPKKTIFMACKSDTLACKLLVDEKAKECFIKYLKRGDVRWITYYDPQVPDCDAKIKGLFETAYFCADATP